MALQRSLAVSLASIETRRAKVFEVASLDLCLGVINNWSLMLHIIQKFVGLKKKLDEKITEKNGQK